MKVRADYRDDATRFEEVEGGFTRMTVARYRRPADGAGSAFDCLQVKVIRELELVARLALMREVVARDVYAIPPSTVQRLECRGDLEDRLPGPPADVETETGLVPQSERIEQSW